MDDQVGEIKRKINIVDVVSEHVALKKKGKNFVGLCPFHGEKTGSFMVNEELQIYKCFGCSAGGDVYKFLMETEGLTFIETLEKLAAKTGVKLVKKTGEVDSKRELLEVHDLAAEYYHYLLVKHPAGEVARQYLVGRGITEKLIRTFRLGYALPAWDGLMEYLMGKKGYGKKILVAAGLVTGGEKQYDRFRGRVMFPLLDISGRVVGFSGRILPPAFAGGCGEVKEAKYINSPETEIYHKSRMLFGLTVAREAIKKNDRVVVVEGELDMISSFAAGVTETVAVKGTAVTEEMLTTLSRLTNNLVLALDTDTAGEAAMRRSIEMTEKLGLNVRMVEITDGKDPDEIAQKRPSQWRAGVDKAVPIYEFFFSKAIAKWGTGSVENIGKIVKEVVPYLAKIENAVIREVWAKKLSEKVGVEKQRVWEEIEKIRSGRVALVEPKSKTETKTDSLVGDLEVINVLLFADISLVERMRKLLTGLPLLGAVGKLAGVLLERNDVGEVRKLIMGLPGELRSLAEGAYMLEIGEMEEKMKLKIVSNWASRMIKEAKQQLTEAMRVENETEEQLGVLGGKLVKLTTLERKLMVG